MKISGETGRLLNHSTNKKRTCEAANDLIDQ